MSYDKPCVLIGVTGCVAAYKTCEIIRGLQKAGVRCKVVMTEHATEFVGPTTFRALTREPVAIELFDDHSNPIHHISLARECDLFLIAPCTANVAAKIAHGIADDLLTTTALATRSPLMLVPAMNSAMYEASATQANLKLLSDRGVAVLEPGDGYQACGDMGRGRMPEPWVVVEAVLKQLPALSKRSLDMRGLSVIVTAGPTVEAIDAVRYISNHSSGKMGYSIAEAACRRGASVTLVSGPVGIPAPEGVNLLKVTSAREMLEVSEGPFAEADVAVFAAAVADYRPELASRRKLKKECDADSLKTITLVENPDVLKTLATRKSNRQFVIGFAAETDDLIENARKKLISKNADMIVANRVGGGLAFGVDDNRVTLVTAASELELDLMAKQPLAHVILDEALRMRGSGGDLA